MMRREEKKAEHIPLSLIELALTKHEENGLVEYLNGHADRKRTSVPNPVQITKEIDSNLQKKNYSKSLS